MPKWLVGKEGAAASSVLDRCVCVCSGGPGTAEAASLLARLGMAPYGYAEESKPSAKWMGNLSDPLVCLLCAFSGAPALIL